MMSDTEKDMFFLENIFVGIHKTSLIPGGDVAFQLPGETPGKFNQKKERIKERARRSGDRSFGTYEYPNPSMTGFRFINGQILSIYDPRGFCLDMSERQTALSYLLNHATISNGAILNKCRWAKNAYGLWLLPEGSPMWDMAVENSQRASEHVNKRLIKPGNILQLDSGAVVKYYGALHWISSTYNNVDLSVCSPSAPPGATYQISGWEYQVSSTNKDRMDFFYVLEGDSTFKKGTLNSAAFRVSRIIDSSTISLQESVGEINDMLGRGLECDHSARWSNRKHIKAVNDSPMDSSQFTINLTPVELKPNQRCSFVALAPDGRKFITAHDGQNNTQYGSLFDYTLMNGLPVAIGYSANQWNRSHTVHAGWSGPAPKVQSLNPGIYLIPPGCEYFFLDFKSPLLCDGKHYIIASRR